MTPVRTRPQHAPSHVATRDGLLAVPRTMTLAEFDAFAWPAHEKWELIFGSPLMSPSAVPNHQRLASRIEQALEAWVNARGLNYEVYQDTSITFREQNSEPRPDVYMCHPLTAEQATRSPIEIIPLLCCEVLSPSNAGVDQGEKLRLYDEAGVSEYWVADPATCGLSIHARAGTGLVACEENDLGVRSPLLNAVVRIERGTRVTDFAVSIRPVSKPAGAK